MAKATAVITGGTGFVGSRLVRALLNRGIEVRILSSGITGRERLGDIAANVKWLGTSDQDIQQAALGATHFYNFAVAYDRPDINDVQMHAVNVDLPIRVIRALHAQDQQTTCVLGDSFFRKFPSTATQQTRYTVAKQMLADRLQDYLNVADRPGLRLALFQIEQVYGPGESVTKVFPRLTLQMLQNKPHIALTHGQQRRDFVHVDDVVEAALTVADADWFGLARIECGMGVATAVRDVLERLKVLTESTSTLGFGDMPSDQSIDASAADLSWLRAKGWSPRIALDEGLNALVADVSARLAASNSSVLHRA